MFSGGIENDQSHEMDLNPFFLDLNTSKKFRFNIISLYFEMLLKSCEGFSKAIIPNWHLLVKSQQ